MEHKKILVLGCPPSYEFGHGDWNMAYLAEFGSGEDRAEVWNVDEKMMLRLKNG